MQNGDKQMKYDAPKGYPFLIIDGRTNEVAAAYRDKEDALNQAVAMNHDCPNRYEVICQDE